MSNLKTLIYEKKLISICRLGCVLELCFVYVYCWCAQWAYMSCVYPAALQSCDPESRGGGRCMLSLRFLHFEFGIFFFFSFIAVLIWLQCVNFHIWMKDIKEICEKKRSFSETSEIKWLPNTRKDIVAIVLLYWRFYFFWVLEILI